MDNIIEYGKLLNKPFCHLIIEKAKPKLVTADVVGPEKEFRVAQNCWLDDNEVPELRGLKEWIAGTTSTPIENQEHGNVVKYDVGGKYELHFDYFDANIPLQAEEFKFGGNRVWSFLVYLNDDFEGGNTFFPEYQLNVEPEMGKGVLWRNTQDGKLLENSIHEGVPVTKGTKWIYITWIREGKYIDETKAS